MCTLVVVGNNDKSAPIPPHIKDTLTSIMVSPRYQLSFPTEFVDISKQAFTDPLYTCDYIVRASQIDSQRHVNHARYLDFFDDTRIFACLQQKLPFHQELRDHCPRKFILDHVGQAKVG